MARAKPPQPKPPAMQLYVRDWWMSTAGMPLAVKGLYMDFLCIAWDHGSIPDDAAWRQRVAGVPAAKTEALWALLRPRWKRIRKGWINPRQERQRRELQQYRAHASHAARQRWATVEHPSGIASSINRASARASARAVPDRSSSSSSSPADQDQDQEQRARARVNHDLLEALAHSVLADVEQGKVPASETVAEMKARAGRAKIHYGDFDEVHRAIRSAEVQRAKRGA